MDVYCFNDSEDDPYPVRCRCVQLDCNGIDTCEHLNNSLLENCEHFEPDPEEMQKLWNHELDANTREAGNPENIIYRYKPLLLFFGYLCVKTIVIINSLSQEFARF